MGDLKVVEGVQRRATKLAQHLYGVSYEDRLQVLELPSMEYVLGRNYESLKKVFALKSARISKKGNYTSVIA